MPAADFAWKPHAKSMSLGELADHLSTIPTWAATVVGSTMFDLETAADRKATVPASREALLAAYDRCVAEARAALASKTDAELMVPWTLKSGGHEIFTMPRLAALRSFVLSHSIHHRGQLSVYLRLRDVPLPSVYGPTADEQ